MALTVAWPRVAATRRMGVLLAVLVIILSVAAILMPAVAAERRVALVIGNGAYERAPLPNTINDARAMTQTLESLGFKVNTLLNGTQKEMIAAIYALSAELEKGGVGLFYYAGHAVQIRGRNFMIPIGARISVEDHVEPESVDLYRMLGRMAGARNSLNIVILDACRDNPFGETFRYNVGGLAQTRAPANSFIAYAAAPGELAADGTGTNSFYTGALVKMMTEPGLSIEEMFKKVSVEVRRATNGQQIPWTSSSITQDFYFTAAPKSAGGAVSTGENKVLDREVVYWQAIYNSTKPQYFDDFLALFPDGVFAGMAREKLAEFGAAEAARDGGKSPDDVAVQRQASPKAAEEMMLAIDQAMAKAGKEGADYAAQVEAGTRVVKERLRRREEIRRQAEEEMRRQAEEARKQLVRAAAEKANKQYQEQLAKAEAEAEATKQRLIAEAAKKAEAARNQAVEEEAARFAKATKLALSLAQRQADKETQEGLAAADKLAQESRREELAKASNDAAEDYRKALAQAEVAAEQMRLRMIEIAKDRADKMLQQKLSEAKRTAAENERVLREKLKRKVEDEAARKLAATTRQINADASAALKVAELRAAEEFEAAIASAREKAEREQAKVIAEAKKAAEAKRDAQIARLAAPPAKTPPGIEKKEAADQARVPEIKNAPGEPKPQPAEDSPPTLQELGLDDNVPAELKRNIYVAMAKAQKRGEGRRGQMLAAVEAIKQYRASKSAAPKASDAPPPTTPLGLTNTNPEIRKIIESTMTLGQRTGKNYDTQVRDALEAVKTYRERNSQSQ